MRVRYNQLGSFVGGIFLSEFVMSVYERTVKQTLTSDTGNEVDEDKSIPAKGDIGGQFRLQFMEEGSRWLKRSKRH